VRRRRGEVKEMSLNITSMMDMFTIILVFLLKSFSTSSASMKVSGDLSLPESTANKPPLEVVTVAVDQKHILVDNKVIITHKEGEIPANQLDESGYKIIPLFEELSKHSEKAKFIASQNEKFDFEGKVLLQMDRELKFKLLRQVMYSAGQAEYNEFKFVASKKE
jgi:biopolymer transport protein ExbD